MLDDRLKALSDRAEVTEIRSGSNHAESIRVSPAIRAKL
jgi:hypothetical protein